jgi:hypothetical protein
VTITVGNASQGGELTITSMDGRTVFSSVPDPRNGETVSLQLDVTGYAKGVYLLKLKQTNQVVTTRFVVQ